MMKAIIPSRKQRGAALVITLIVLVALATVVVAFMQNTTMERASSRSITNVYRAQLAAESGVERALSLLMQTTKSRDEDAEMHGPYATVFSTDPSGGVAPYLLFARRELDADALKTKRLPLFSSTFPLAGYFDDLSAPLIDAKAQSISDSEDGNAIERNVSETSDLVADLNLPTAGRPNGLVGLIKNGARIPLPVNWIYFRDNSGAVVGRFAYWVDDESSKLDVRFAGGDANGVPVQRGGGTNRGEVRLEPLIQKGLSSGQLTNLRNYRKLGVPLLEKSFARFPLEGGDGGIEESDLWDAVSPYLTAASSHDRRAPDGKIKLNLNRAIKAAPDELERIKEELDAIKSAIVDNLPDFGKRVAAGASPAEADFYLMKIAANIRDFVDSDNVPTMVARDGEVLSFSGIAPDDFIPLGTDLIVEDIPAIGKEKGPFLSEYLRVVRVVSEAPVEGVNNLFNLRVVFGHYVELHNPTGTPITAKDIPGGYIRLANREPWENGATGRAPATLRPADIIMRFPSDFEIPANGYAVLTTDNEPIDEVEGKLYRLTSGEDPGQWSPAAGQGKDLPIVGEEAETYAVTTTSGNRSGQDRPTRFNFYVRTTSTTPYQDAAERLIVGAEKGIIDAAPKIYTALRHYLGRGADNPAYLWTFPSDPSTSNRNTPANSNAEARFNRGDLRANMEISGIGNHAGATWRPGSNVYASKFKEAAETFLTLGARNYNFDRQDTPSGDNWWRMGWKEYTTDPAGNHFVPNRPLRSIGELGFVFDPARHSLAGYRAHGSTLRLGQSDGGSNNRAENNSSANFSNWLGGRGSDDPTKSDYLRNAFLLTDVFAVNDFDAGRVNPNSLVRDGGFVFSSLVDGFAFEASAADGASVALAGKTIDPETFLPEMVRNATVGGGLISPGDLSRADVFNKGTAVVSGVDMAKLVSDAGKEEFFRRTADLLTTHSLSFTIYSIGQSGKFEGNTFRPASTAVKEVILQLKPNYPAPSNDFERVAPSGWSIVKLKEMSH